MPKQLSWNGDCQACLGKKTENCLRTIQCFGVLCFVKNSFVSQPPWLQASVSLSLDPIPLLSFSLPGNSPAAISCSTLSCSSASSLFFLSSISAFACHQTKHHCVRKPSIRSEKWCPWTSPDFSSPKLLRSIETVEQFFFYLLEMVMRSSALKVDMEERQGREISLYPLSFSIGVSNQLLCFLISSCFDSQSFLFRI